MYIHKGSEPLEEAFHIAHRADGYDNGHQYSGTLASKGSVTLIQTNPLTPSEAQELADRIMADRQHPVSDTWGPAGAIPLLTEPQPTATRTVRVAVTVTHNGHDLSDPYRQAEALRSAGTSKVKVGKGERVVDVVTPLDFQGKHLPSPQVQTRVKAATLPGKAVTRYVVIDDRGRDVVGWSDGFATLAEARAQIVARLKDHPDAGGNIHGVSWSIHAVTRRDADTALVSVVREVVKVSAEVEVTVGSFPPADRVHVGWLFFGLAPS